MKNSILDSDWYALWAGLHLIGFLVFAVPFVGLLLVYFFRMSIGPSRSKRSLRDRVLTNELGKDGLPVFYDLDYDYTRPLSEQAGMITAKARRVPPKKSAGPKRVA